MNVEIEEEGHDQMPKLPKPSLKKSSCADTRELIRSVPDRESLENSIASSS